jgi:hypothetical protein
VEDAGPWRRLRQTAPQIVELLLPNLPISYYSTHYCPYKLKRSTHMKRGGHNDLSLLKWSSDNWPPIMKSFKRLMAHLTAIVYGHPTLPIRNVIWL